MKLNTGQFLRRGYESDYGTHRRLLWANRMQWGNTTLRSIKSELQAKGADVSAIDTLQDLAALIHSWEPDAELADQLLLDGYLADKAIRNCPQCARMIYHSRLFQLPWLKYCPLHQCRIVQHCPDCGMPWPKLHECRTRKCATCSLEIPLVSMGARRNTDSHIASKLGPLAACLAAQRPTPRYVLKCVDPNKRYIQAGSADHQNIDMLDPYYPSLVVQRNPGCRQIFTELQVALPKVSTFHFTSDDYLGKQESDEAKLFDAVTKRLRQCVLRQFGFDVIRKSRLLTDQACRESVIRHAWKALHFVFKYDRGEEITAEHGISTREFQQLGINNPPMLTAPTTMLGLELRDPVFCNEQRHHNSWRHEALPTSAVEIIYQASLWCLFIRLVGFYDQLGCLWLRIGPWSSYSERRVTIEEFERVLPDIAHPLLPTNIHLCLRPDGEQLLLTLPTEYYLGSLDGLSLKTPDSTQVAADIS